MTALAPVADLADWRAMDASRAVGVSTTTLAAWVRRGLVRKYPTARGPRYKITEVTSAAAPIIDCGWCGSTFVGRPLSKHRDRFCSRSCAASDQAESRRGRYFSLECETLRVVKFEPAPADNSEYW